MMEERQNNKNNILSLETVYIESDDEIVNDINKACEKHREVLSKEGIECRKCRCFISDLLKNEIRKYELVNTEITCRKPMNWSKDTVKQIKAK